MGVYDDEPERLVLLETLVHSVHYDKEAIEIDPEIKDTLGPTCVTVRFLDRPALAVSEEEQDDARCYSDRDVLLQAGKSLLFAASNDELLPPCPAVEVLISRKRCGSRDLVIGRADIPLTETFTHIFNTVPIAPTCESVQGVYDFRDTCSRVIGCVSLFLRLSAFGKMLVAGEESVAPEEDCFKIPRAAPRKAPVPAAECCVASRTCPLCPGNTYQPPCEPIQGPCDIGSRGPCPLPTPFTPRRFCPSNIEPFPPGYSMCQRITVGDPSSSDEDEDGSKKKKGYGCPLEPMPGDYCLRTDCPCGLTYPPWLTPPCPPSPPRQFKLDPGAVGVHCGQVIFDLGDNEDGERAAPEGAQFRVEPACGSVPCVALTGPGDTWPAQEPGREVFLLRASRRSDDGTKPTLELELRAPKCPDKRFIDQQTQYHEPENGAKGKKAGKGGGKGAKGGGKGKGKKK